VPVASLGRLLQPLASHGLVVVGDLARLSESHARVERVSLSVLPVVAERCLTMPIRRSPFKQLSDHPSTVSPSLILAVDEQSADPEALVVRVDPRTSRTDNLVSGPDGERVPRTLPVRTQSQVVGHGRHELPLRLLHLQPGACPPVVCADVLEGHGATLVQNRPRGAGSSSHVISVEMLILVIHVTLLLISHPEAQPAEARRTGYAREFVGEEPSSVRAGCELGWLAIWDLKARAGVGGSASVGDGPVGNLQPS
jgi:hypothetical protein